MASDLHGNPSPGTGGDQAEKQPCPCCGEQVKNVGVHLRYRCRNAGGADA